ncbi:regulatory protein GemA [Pararhodobacter sp.]|uniref:gp16 family protein n=1 Tax=Pararhodobacter sp. TaxID=2127056 RepID=UPI002AFE4685|nr:regulatory protein GemA [Pararhodobacter sp.]
MSAALIRKVHVGCKQLGLDTETRHDLQAQVTGKASLSAMTEPELKAMLKALENRGFKPTATGRKPAAPRADLRFVHKLWSMLGEAGALREPGRRGLNAFVRARFGASWGSVPADIDMLTEWAQIADVIDALKAMCKRAGVDVEKP